MLSYKEASTKPVEVMFAKILSLCVTAAPKFHPPLNTCWWKTEAGICASINWATSWSPSNHRKQLHTYNWNNHFGTFELRNDSFVCSWTMMYIKVKRSDISQCRWFMTTTGSDISNASSWSCVTKIVAAFNSSCKRRGFAKFRFLLSC